MIESIKEQLWDQLKEKEVSLVMIFDKCGEILWHKGRKIEGKSIHMGQGFPKSLAKKIISNGDMVKKENVDLMVFGEKLSESAKNLCLKSLLIFPISQNFFLYTDSGTKDCFSDSDREVFKALGLMLAKMIEKLLNSSRSNDGITGHSKEIKKIREMVAKYALEDEPVLLIGETGVGKSHIAELVHRCSGRKGRFEVAEITSINENLFESTMFGHKKGSFTDAKSNRTGLVQEADQGTLFIDEIAEIPITFQSKILRFIDKKKYRILGESQEREADVRIIAASNRDLPKAIKNKEFREDLYYRLHVLEIEIPPVRKRKEDINDFVAENCRYLKGKEIGAGFWEAIKQYDWPGNWRELNTVLKRAGILLDSPITAEKINKIIYGQVDSKQQITVEDVQQQIWQKLDDGKSFWEVVKNPFLKRDLNRNQVKAIVAWALSKANGSYKKSLPFLNIDENHYTKYMKFLYRNHLT